MGRHKLRLLAGAVVVLAPVAWYGLGALAMGSSGPPWVPGQQAEERSSIVRGLLESHRPTLEALEAAQPEGADVN